MQTECPNCHTLFRITEAQLNMAEGKVRCGFCKEVFDARLESEVRQNRSTAQVSKANQVATEQFIETVYPDPSVEYELENETLFSGAADASELDTGKGHSNPGSYSTTATALWSLGILALIAALAAEYVWFNQPEILQDQRWKPVTAKLCEYTDCDHLQKRDPSLIEMISRNVYTHPNEKDALMVSTTLVNHASYAQPYPDVQIDFSNVRGKLIASRRFRPEEYLKLDHEQTGLLQSGNQIAFGLEIRDPGSHAITYEFSFH